MKKDVAEVNQQGDEGCCAAIKRIARGARKRLARVTSQLSEAFMAESTTPKPTRSFRRPRFLEPLNLLCKHILHRKFPQKISIR